MLHELLIKAGLIVILVAGALITACDRSTGMDSREIPDKESGVVGIIYPDTGLTDVLGQDVYAEENIIHVLTTGKGRNAEILQLTYIRSLDGGLSWSEPLTIPQNGEQKLFLSGPGGHPPQIAVSGEQMVVMWAIHGSGWGGAGPLVVRYSNDAGRTWSTGFGPADTGVPDGQSFHDLLADANGIFHAVWLDGRTGQQGLYQASSRDGGRTWSRNRPVDNVTCQCCGNSLATGSDNILYVLYRDLDPRDMALARSDDGSADWRRRSTVGHFNWHFDGCPHTGGGLEARGDQLYATVWTGAAEYLGAYVLRSNDGGGTWSAPYRLGSAHARHTDLAVGAGGHLLAVWDALIENTLTIQMAVSSDSGKNWELPIMLRQSRSILAQPRTIAIDSGFAVFWLEGKSESGAVWACLPIPLPEGLKNSID